MLDGGAGFGRGGEIGAALLQPPKSSSAVTFGGACEPKPTLPKPPLEEGPVPHGKSFEEVVIGGDLNDGAPLVVGAGSGVAHASFEPQASLLENPEKALLAADDAIGADFGCEGAGADRLNADCRLIDGEEAFWVTGAGAGADGDESPKRSFGATAEAGFVVCLGGLVAKLKSPKSSMGILSGFGCCEVVRVGLEAVAGLAAGFWDVSKKPPPLRGGEVS